MTRRSGGRITNIWHDDTSKYFSVRHPEAFKAAIEKAAEDGTIDSWAWNQLLGKSAPPGYQWNGTPEPQDEP
jgi:hypothetical protein